MATTLILPRADYETRGDSHPDFEPKYQKSQDEDHRALAFEKIFEEVMLIRRRQDLELYRLVASDAALKSSLQQSMRGMLG